MSFTLFPRVSSWILLLNPQGTGPLFTNLVSLPPKRLLLMQRLSLYFAYRLLLLPLLTACLWISPIFTTLNKDGTSHLILNLKRLNLLITHIPFKIESIRDVVHMVKRGVRMDSVILRLAYYSVSIHAPHRPLSFLFLARHILPLSPAS